MGLREIVYMGEQKLSDYTRYNDDDINACHITLCYEGMPVACGRAFLDGECIRIGMFLVLKEYRSKGFGSILCEELMKNGIRLFGNRFLILSSQIQAIGFYEKQGFEVTSYYRYVIEGLEHVRMEKKVES